MKRLVLFFLALLPVGATCQQRDVNLTVNDAGSPFSPQTIVAITRNDGGTSLEPASPHEGESALPKERASTSPQKSEQPRPQASTTVEDSDEHRIRKSNVGYIDNAIVGSEVVMRIETEFQNLTPDLSEFLYPKCNCSGIPGQGPGTGPPGLAKNLNAQMLHLYGEYALNRRFSVFTEVPVRWIQPLEVTLPSPNSKRFVNQLGLGDVMAGFKFALVASPQRYVTFEVQTFFPSGNASKGLGTNHYSVQPSVLYYQKLTDRLTLESEIGELHPIGGTPGFAGDILDYGVGPSYTLFRTKRLEFTPLVEFIGWHIFSGMVTDAPRPRPGPPPPLNLSACNEQPPAADPQVITNPCSAVSNILNLKGGARITIGSHNSIYAGYGRALTGLYWYLRVFRLEYRYSF